MSPDLPGEKGESGEGVKGEEGEGDKESPLEGQEIVFKHESPCNVRVCVCVCGADGVGGGAVDSETLV